MKALAKPKAVAGLAASWRDGQVKQAVIARTLALRRNHEQVFAQGSYEPLLVEGPMAEHVIAYARRFGPTAIVTVVPRLPLTLMKGPDSIVLDATAWQGTFLRWSGSAAVFDALLETHLPVTKGTLSMAAVCKTVPVALLCATCR
jgi:maltooligosyltrehalose synthase